MCVLYSLKRNNYYKVTLAEAEKKPVEPEQGNACEGKVTATRALLIAIIPVPFIKFEKN
jgi:hypothetical protein